MYIPFLQLSQYEGGLTDESKLWVAGSAKWDHSTITGVPTALLETDLLMYSQPGCSSTDMVPTIRCYQLQYVRDLVGNVCV